MRSSVEVKVSTFNYYRVRSRLCLFAFVIAITFLGCSEARPADQTPKAYQESGENKNVGVIGRNEDGQITPFNSKTRKELLGKYVDRQSLDCDQIVKSEPPINYIAYETDVIHYSNRLPSWLETSVNRLVCLELEDTIAISDNAVTLLAMMAHSIGDKSEIQHFTASWVQFRGANLPQNIFEHPMQRLTLLFYLEPWEGRLYGRPDDAPPVRPYARYQGPIIRDVDKYFNKLWDSNLDSK